MKILSIETSCDETSVAIVEDGRKVLSNIVSSQISIHEKFGGVVPEICSRQHLSNISYVVDNALEKADITIDKIDKIAVTVGPGLIGALLVGVAYAKSLAYANNIQLIPVHHIRGHIAANYITHIDLKPPFIALVVSGGHTNIILVKDYTKFKNIARTRDDAAGEAFDKVARVLGLNYPGGPKLSKLAENGKHTYNLPKAKMDNLDFSFSGIKTAVINIANKEKEKLNKENLARSFEDTVVDILVDNVIIAAKKEKQQKIVLAGGVSANTHLRDVLQKRCKNENLQVYMPDLMYCTDNAAMIGACAYYEYLDKNILESSQLLSLNAHANYDI